MPWENLIGTTLNDGWRVVSRVERDPLASGGTFSISFNVQRGSEAAFLKAFDIESMFRRRGGDLAKLQYDIESINSEKSLLEACRAAKVQSVAVAIASGQVIVSGCNMDQPIDYLIFEKASRDVRSYHNYRADINVEFNLRVLRQATHGLSELHKLEIAHQDFKPSNVLLYEASAGGALEVIPARVADLGRSSTRTKPIWHDLLSFAGDRNYAPLEALYGHTLSDWAQRRVSGDLFMLGSFAHFLFTGASMNAHLFHSLPIEFHPVNWNDHYLKVSDYLRRVMNGCLDEVVHVGSCWPEVRSVIKELCDPDPAKRGSPRINTIPAKYSLQRYLSKFDRLMRLQRMGRAA